MLISRLVSQFGRHQRDVSGQVAVAFGLSALPALLMIGAGVDYGRTMVAQSRLQAGVDSAALTLATAGASADSAQTIATNVVQAALASSDVANVSVVATQNKDGSYTVTGSADEPTTIMSLVQPAITISRTATAALPKSATSGPAACVIALGTTGAAINVDANGSITSSCGVYSNSAASNGLNMGAGAVMTAKSVCVVGSVRYDNSPHVTPSPKTGCPAISDPLSAMAAPANAGNACDYVNRHVVQNTTVTLSPGIYCGGINLENGVTATLQPGIYIIRDGSFTTGKSARVTGSQVMIYLTGAGANINQDASGKMQLTGPVSGAFKGIVIYQDRNSTPAGSQFGSGAGNKFQGVIYMPRGYLHIDAGGATDLTDWTILIVNSLFVDASTSLVITSNFAGSTTPLPDAIAGGAPAPARLTN